MEIAIETIQYGNENSICPHHRIPQKYRVIKGGFEILPQFYLNGFEKFSSREFLVSKYGSRNRITFEETFKQASAIGYELINNYNIKKRRSCWYCW